MRYRKDDWEAILHEGEYEILEDDEEPWANEAIVYHEVYWEWVCNDTFKHAYRTTEPRWVLDLVPIRRDAIFAYVVPKRNSERYKVFRLAVNPNETWVGPMPLPEMLDDYRPDPPLALAYMKQLRLLSEIDKEDEDIEWEYDPFGDDMFYHEKLERYGLVQ